MGLYFGCVILKHIHVMISLWANYSHVNATGPQWWEFNSGSENGQLTLVSKTLPEPVLRWHMTSAIILTCSVVNNSLDRHRCIIKIPLNTLRPRQNGRHFPDDIFKCISLNENVWISIKISLNSVPNGPINNIPALVQIMAWRRPGDKPLSEPMMVCLVGLIRPQWVSYYYKKDVIVMSDNRVIGYWSYPFVENIK